MLSNQTKQNNTRERTGALNESAPINMPVQIGRRKKLHLQLDSQISTITGFDWMYSLNCDCVCGGYLTERNPGRGATLDINSIHYVSLVHTMIDGENMSLFTF